MEAVAFEVFRALVIIGAWEGTWRLLRRIEGPTRYIDFGSERPTPGGFMRGVYQDCRGIQRQVALLWASDGLSVYVNDLWIGKTAPVEGIETLEEACHLAMKWADENP